jgi:hypothetical protein
MPRPLGAVNKHKPFRAALTRALDAAGDNPKKLDRIALALIAQAETGDVTAIREIADRLDGKVAQAVIGDDEHEPVRLIITGVPRAGDT